MKYIYTILLVVVFSIHSFAQTTESESNNYVNQSGIKYITGTGVYQGTNLPQGDDDIWYIPFGSSGTISITLDNAGAGNDAYLQCYGNSSYYDFSASSYIATINYNSTKSFTLSANKYYFFVVRGSTVSATGPWQFTVNSVGTILGGVVFTDGSAFTPSVAAGNSNQVIGRFKLEENINKVNLTGASIKLNGTRTGLSNFKFWSSNDNAFDAGADTLRGIAVPADPGDGNAVSFNGFASEIGKSQTYYFLTCDVASGASGSVQGEIVQNSDLTISNGSLKSALSNEVLSNNYVPLPVELTSFTAYENNGNVELHWQTATEVDNYGFEVERASSRLVGTMPRQDEWNKISFVQGHGNSNSPKEYSFTDKDNLSGMIRYRLKQIDTDGSLEYFPNKFGIEVEIDMPTKFELFQNYPNPFFKGSGGNPTTTIKYAIPSLETQDIASQLVILKIYDILGREVATLVNENQKPGIYEVDFNASNFPSGIYIYRLVSGRFVSSKKLLLVK
ncbi:MAG: T9SS type A sorting domain-containing protein [Chlorobi bacterium]|nr:T9SS type A sorting domain-containing protein [Chlorobiota bacterium]